MTDLEFDYIKRAIATLESGECSLLTEAKILQTISEICGKNATAIRDQFTRRVDQNLANQHLVDMLKK